jgi:hypothetical protein
MIDTIPINSPTYNSLNQYYSIAGFIKSSSSDNTKGITLLYFDNNSSTGYFITKNECDRDPKRYDFTYTVSDNLVSINLNKEIDLKFPKEFTLTQTTLIVKTVNNFDHSPDEYSYESPCSMRGRNPNYYVIELLNNIEIGEQFTSITYDNFMTLFNTDVKNITFKGVDTQIENKEVKRNDFLEKYNESHSCSDQGSFDEGYNLARDQYGVTNDFDLPDYLYRISINLGFSYNSYCFKKGVEQYINDKSN